MQNQSQNYEANSKITEILKSIGNRRRLQILWELSDGRERSVSQIEQVIPILASLRYRNILANCGMPRYYRHAVRPRQFIIRSKIRI